MNTLSETDHDSNQNRHFTKEERAMNFIHLVATDEITNTKEQTEVSLSKAVSVDGLTL